MNTVLISLCFVVICLQGSVALVKFDHTNCMEMRPRIIQPKIGPNGMVLAFAKIYSIYISSSNFQSGSPIRIVIKSCKAPDGVFHGMKAFLLQARSLEGSNRPVGYFQESSLSPNAKPISCYYPYDSVVNKGEGNAKELSATWIPPRNFRGTIAFYLTVIPFNTQGYYLRVKSPRISPGNGTSISLQEKCLPSKANGNLASNTINLMMTIFIVTLISKN